MSGVIIRALDPRQTKRLLKLLLNILPEGVQSEILSPVTSKIIKHSIDIMNINCKQADDMLKERKFDKHIEVLKAAGSSSLFTTTQKSDLSMVYAKYANALSKYEPSLGLEQRKQIRNSLRLDPNNQMAVNIHFSNNFDGYTLRGGPYGWEYEDRDEDEEEDEQEVWEPSADCVPKRRSTWHFNVVSWAVLLFVVI